ncbi:MAG: peroxiredoxin [Rickettsiales bacterium]|nr:peroxiredoxin [Rickettsiales bacterium]
MTVLVGKKAPDFTASAIMPDNTINEDFTLSNLQAQGKLVVLFFYPLDFTFVCPSEIIAFDKRLSEFKNRNVEVIAVSVDSVFTHLAYKNTDINEGGIGKIQYPMVSDITKKISRDYDVLHNDSVSYRGTFLIDKNGIVRHQIVNDLPLGRSVDEAIRMVDALLFHEENGEVCPANWKPGKSAIVPNKEGIADYLQKNSANL